MAPIFSKLTLLTLLKLFYFPAVIVYSAYLIDVFGGERRF